MKHKEGDILISVKEMGVSIELKKKLQLGWEVEREDKYNLVTGEKRPFPIRKKTFYSYEEIKKQFM